MNFEIMMKNLDEYHPPFSKKELEEIKQLTNTPLRIDHYRQAIEFISKQKQSKLKILDIGSFVGLFVDFLNKHENIKAIGIEKNNKFVKYTRRHKIKTIKDNFFSSLNYLHDYDIIVVFNFLEQSFLHKICSDLIINKILKNSYKILKQKGHVLIRTQKKLKLNKQFKIKEKKEFNDFFFYVLEKI
jgi:2-polyprenyl-3-methyl-5-hydroxy-6-metoxy-1,4-benzoquinol methylase